LAQDTILQNLILTGLRGVGKTVLAETFNPIAIQEKWVWVGTDLSEATSVSESNLAIRIITDLSVITSALTLTAGEQQGCRIHRAKHTDPKAGELLLSEQETPGLTVDKLKAVLEFVWGLVKQTDRKGVIFAYDEAQTILESGFGNSHVNQMLGALANAGLVYKNRRGKYSFAVALMADFIRRQYQE
jgi:phage pi2 protein 07